MVGIGFDMHRFGGNGPLIIGGVEIPYDKGVIAHSDGDVLIHALIDALSGALGRADIGELFPDTDPSLKGADSVKMLEKVVAEMGDINIVNVDSVIILDKPSLSVYKQKIKDSISRILNIPPERVGIKAKTTEGLFPKAVSAMVTVQLA